MTPHSANMRHGWCAATLAKRWVYEPLFSCSDTVGLTWSTEWTGSTTPYPRPLPRGRPNPG